MTDLLAVMSNLAYDLRSGKIMQLIGTQDLVRSS